MFCRGTVLRSNPGEKPGWLNVPVIYGGVIVNPGDLILGDEDGVVVIPRELKPSAGHRGRADGNQRPRDGNIPPRASTAQPHYLRRGVEEKLQARGDIVWR